MIDHLLEIRAVQHLGGYSLRLEFSNGEVRAVDLTGELWGQMFEPLRDVGLFSQAYVDLEAGTVCWPNGADFAPDTLYAKGSPVETAAA